MGIQINNKQVLDMKYLGKKAYSAVLNSDYVFASTLKKVSGVLQNIKDAAALPINKLYLEGNSYQETTSGKNLFGTDLLPVTKNGITISRNENGDIVLNGTPTITSGYTNITIGKYTTFPAGTYTMSLKEKKVGIGTIITGSVFNGKANLTLTDTKRVKTTTINSDNKGECQINVRYDVGTLNNFILNPQLEKGSTETPEYEPYTNGASPNPDYPQEVEVIEGSVDVDIVGENLFDAHDLKSTNSGKIGEDDWITVSYNNTNGTSDKWPNYYTNVSKMLKPSTDYVIMLEIKEITGDVYAIQPSTYNVNTLPGQFSYNTTLKEDALKVGTYRFINKTLDSFDICTNMLRTVITFQAGKKGSITFRLSVLEDRNIMPDTFVYKPYRGTTTTIDLQDNFLAKIGDIKDELDVVTGKLTKRIGKVVLNGSESWTQTGTQYNGLYSAYISLTSMKRTSVFDDILSSHFKSRSFSVQEEGITKSSQPLDYDYVILRLSNTKATTINEFKTWLASNNVEVYYVLAEPYEVQLDTTKIPLFEGINNVKVNTNLEPSLTELDYYIR